MAKATAATNEPKRALILVMADGTKKRVEVMASYKVTYGPALPMKNTDRFGGVMDKEGALRIYRSASDVIAMFRGVAEFWEEGLQITKRVKNLKYKHEGQTATNEKGVKVSSSESHETEFCNVPEVF